VRALICKFFTAFLFLTATVSFSQTLEERLTAHIGKIDGIKKLDSNNDGIYHYAANAPGAFTEGVKLLGEIATADISAAQRDQMRDRLIEANAALYIHGAAPYIDSQEANFLPETATWWDRLLDKGRVYFTSIGKALLRNTRSEFFTLLDAPRRILPRSMRWRSISDESIFEDMFRNETLKSMLAAIHAEIGGKDSGGVKKTVPEQKAIALYKLMLAMKRAEPHRFASFNVVIATGCAMTGAYFGFFPIELGPLTGTSADFWRTVEAGYFLGAAGSQVFNSGLTVHAAYRKVEKQFTQAIKDSCEAPLRTRSRVWNGA
jgi:hypothetical protein